MKIRGPYKVVQAFQYTEVVYFDADGTEVGREKQNDTMLYDQARPAELSEQERADWGLE